MSVTPQRWVKALRAFTHPTMTEPASYVSSNKGAVAEVGERLLELVARIHDERTVARNRLTQGLRRDEQETHGRRAGCDLNGVAIVPDDEFWMRNFVPGIVRAACEIPRARKNISK